MLIRSLAFATVASFAFAAAAQAQNSAPQTPTEQEAAPPATEKPGATPATPANPATQTPATPATPPTAESAASPSSAVAAAAELKAGAAVTDAAGGQVGTISSVHGGHVTLAIDGKTYTVPAKSLSTASGVIVSSSTKAQIQGAKPQK